MISLHVELGRSPNRVILIPCYRQVLFVIDLRVPVVFHVDIKVALRIDKYLVSPFQIVKAEFIGLLGCALL